MPIVTLSEFRDAVPRGARVMGLDLGSKTIGIALSDTGFAIASPLQTLRRKKFTADAGALMALIDEHDVGGLVLGLPINMDGTEGPRYQSTRQFAANLLEKFNIPIAFQDERLSTAAVERVLIGEADMTRKRRGEVIDKMAAAWILQGALDIVARQPRNGD